MSVGFRRFLNGCDEVIGEVGWNSRFDQRGEFAGLDERAFAVQPLQVVFGPLPSLLMPGHYGIQEGAHCLAVLAEPGLDNTEARGCAGRRP